MSFFTIVILNFNCNQMFRFYLLFIFIIILCPTIGCGPSGPQRAVVSGTVTYDGKEVGDGEISFIPKQGTSGSGGGGRIRHGKYKIDLSGGIPLGDYKVSIVGYELAPGAEPPPAVIDLDTSRGKKFLPAKYNLRTELEFSVTEKSEIEKNFDLKK